MINIFFQWVFWHFIEMPKEIVRAWKNFFLFNLNYFSIFLLLKTLFFPWRKYSCSYGRGFDFNRYIEAFLSNLIFRILGAVIRSVLIFVGLLTQIFIVLVGAIVLISWLLLPAFLIAGLIFGFIVLLP